MCVTRKKNASAHSLYINVQRVKNVMLMWQHAMQLKRYLHAPSPSALSL